MSRDAAVYADSAVSSGDRGVSSKDAPDAGAATITPTAIGVQPGKRDFPLPDFQPPVGDTVSRDTDKGAEQWSDSSQAPTDRGLSKGFEVSPQAAATQITPKPSSDKRGPSGPPEIAKPVSLDAQRKTSETPTGTASPASRGAAKGASGPSGDRASVRAGPPIGPRFRAYLAAVRAAISLPVPTLDFDFEEPVELQTDVAPMGTEASPEHSAGGVPIAIQPWATQPTSTPLRLGGPVQGPIGVGIGHVAGSVGAPYTFGAEARSGGVSIRPSVARRDRNAPPALEDREAARTLEREADDARACADMLAQEAAALRERARAAESQGYLGRARRDLAKAAFVEITASRVAIAATSRGRRVGRGTASADGRAADSMSGGGEP